MEFRKSMSIHNPPKSYGDCIRACIATLTDDEQVPHVFSGIIEPEKSWYQLRLYLKSKNKFLFLVGVESHEKMAENNPDIPYMLICGSKTGNHAVICLNGKMIHNPAYYPSEITSPPENSDEFVVGIIGDLV